jgi:hypothetical protein
MKKFYIAALIISLLLTPVQTYAATSKSTANYTSVYASWLKKHPSKTVPSSSYYTQTYNPKDKSYVNTFFMYDIDSDGTPELFTETDITATWFIMRIYTCKKGKIVKYKFKSGKAAVFNNNGSARGNYGSYDFIICYNNHIHNKFYLSGYNEEIVYRLDNNKFSKFLTKKLYTDSATYKKYSKTITYEEYKELTSTCYVKKPYDTYKNTASARSKLRKGKLGVVE